MRLNILSRTYFVLSYLFLSSSALPFLSRSQAAQPQAEPILNPRASYSVVPVDGGAQTATAGAQVAGTTTVSETVIQTAPASPAVTVTVVSTVASAGKETVTSVITVTEHDVVQTSLVTIIPAPVTITITAPAQQTFTSVVSESTQTSSLSSTLSPPSGTSTLSSITSVFSSSTTSPTATSTFDNGQWHTTYPAWSNSSSATVVAIKPRQTTILS